MKEKKVTSGMTDSKISVVALTGGVNVPSARFRVRQLIPELYKNRIDMHELPSRVPVYPPKKRSKRLVWAFGVLAARIPDVLATYKYDIVFLQREFVSTFYTFEGCTKKPRVLDVDDAIFLRKGGGYARKLAKECDLVVCGNAYLANHFELWNQNVVVIPTAVDTEKYYPLRVNKKTTKKIIGWIGTSANHKYLYKIENSLSKVLKMCPETVFRVVSDATPDFYKIDKHRYEFVRWSPAVEIDSIQEMSVGIMPLKDDDWGRGKCSFKMLQYMSCGLPVVVSPVGMNEQVLALGDLGISAETDEQWVDALVHLMTNETLRVDMGSRGREIVLQHFSTKIVSELLAAQLVQMV